MRVLTKSTLRGGRKIRPLAVAVVVFAAMIVAGQSGWAQTPEVDGFLRDPVTGVVEGAYVINGITYTQDQISGDFAGYLYTAEDGENFYFGFEQSVYINDNTYQANAIGWPGKRGHRLKDLLNSEHIKVKLYDCSGNLALEFFLDYATKDRSSGEMENLGVSGGDGAMLFGDPAHITGSGGGLVWNFNLASPTYGDKWNTNPQRVPTNTYDPGTTADPNAPWIYELTYEWSVAKAAFPSGCFGAIEILEVHNSPFKTGNPVPMPVLNVSKTSDPVSGSVVDPGQTITYEITATNVGMVTLNGVMITDVVDDNLDNVVPLDGGSYDAGTRTVSWGPVMLAPAEFVTVRFQADVAPASPATGDCPNGLKIFNTGVISSPDLPTDVETNTTEHCVNPRPILTIVKDANPTTASPGDTVGYTITVSNIGSSTATLVTLTDDPDETYIAGIANISDGGVYDGDLITWDLGSLAPSASATVTYDGILQDANSGVFPHGTTPVINVATVDSAETDPISDDAVVLVTAAALLTIDKVGDPQTASPGDTIHYTITIQNTGNAAATNVTLVDDPDETYVAGISNLTDGGTYDGDLISWSLGTMAPGDVVVRTYDATLAGPGNFPPGITEVVNTATVDSDETDAATDGETVTVEAFVLLTLDKATTNTSPVTRSVTNTGSLDSDQTDPVTASATDADVVVATRITYTLTYSNSGNADATGVVLTDTLADGTSFVSASDGGTYDGGANTVTWNIGTVGAGATGSVTLVVETTN